MTPLDLALLSVNSGVARVIGTRHGEPVLSAIAKSPIAVPIAFVGLGGIAGDVQADRSVHGGPDKALHAYSAHHWRWWRDETGLDCAPGCFGENFTVGGADESEISIGDRFRWGGAILEVSQPRGPCANLDLHAGRSDVAQTMTLSGRTGWYFRVLQEGDAPTRGATASCIFTSGGPSVRDAVFARHDRGLPLLLRQYVHDAPALAESWRRAIAKTLVSNK
ncbi:MAG TPA: MOSC domain-containing protein [Rhizomicrobium sp.]